MCVNVLWSSSQVTPDSVHFLKTGSFTVARTAFARSNTLTSKHWDDLKLDSLMQKDWLEQHVSAVNWSPLGLKLTDCERMIQYDLSSTRKHPICKYSTRLQVSSHIIFDHLCIVSVEVSLSCLQDVLYVFCLYFILRTVKLDIQYLVYELLTALRFW